MSVELIIREFGKPVADIVMDLPKGGKKAQAIQAALKKSREAKLIKKKSQTAKFNVRSWVTNGLVADTV